MGGLQHQMCHQAAGFNRNICLWVQFRVIFIINQASEYLIYQPSNVKIRFKIQFLRQQFTFTATANYFSGAQLFFFLLFKQRYKTTSLTPGAFSNYCNNDFSSRCAAVSLRGGRCHHRRQVTSSDPSSSFSVSDGLMTAMTVRGW